MSDIIMTDRGIAEHLQISLKVYYRLLPEMKESGAVLQRRRRVKCADGKYRTQRINYAIPEVLIRWQMLRGGLL